MCGIAGVRTGGGRLDSSALEAMAKALHRRGPDGRGIHEADGAGLVHTRLAIMDLSDRGAQPMANEDGTIHLVFNGEIYNHVELRRDLEARSHAFRSRMDGECILHLYEEHRDDPAEVARRLRGMFAFALWDGPRRELVLGRDRFGIKPLFVHDDGASVRFASDLDALLADPAVPRRLDWTSVYDYLVLRTVPGPWSILRDVALLPAGHVMTVGDDGSRKTVRYWSPPAPEDDVSPDVADALEDAVRRHVQADVPVATFLSAGIDSGLVTALTTDAHSGPCNSYSLSYPGEEVDEGPEAATVAARLGTEHSEVQVRSSLLANLDDAVKAMDQPMALESALSVDLLAQRARQDVKVVLTGDGGDELFLGYHRHRLYPVPVKALEHIPETLRPHVGAVARALLPGWVRGLSEFTRKAGSVADRLVRYDSEKYVPRLYSMAPEVALSILPPDVQSEVDTTRYLRRVNDLIVACPSDDPQERMIRADIQSSLADEMLAKVDRMTMAHGLEARVPLLDDAFADRALRIPARHKRRGQVGKLPLRDLARPRLGAAIADRIKSGFAAPTRRWFLEDEATAASFRERMEAASRSNVLDGTAIARLLAPAPEDPKTEPGVFFLILVLDQWLRSRPGVSA